MSTKSTKTIDDLGYGVYSRYEEDRRYFDEKLLAESKAIAHQMTTDVFEPILISEHHVLFDLHQKKASWSMLAVPDKYHDQKRRLFTFQLAPKLGPEERIEMHMSRIEGKKEQEEKREKEEEKEEEKGKKPKKSTIEREKNLKEVADEAKILIQLMQDINVLNKLIAYIDAERHRYSKG